MRDGSGVTWGVELETAEDVEAALDLDDTDSLGWIELV